MLMVTSSLCNALQCCVCAMLCNVVSCLLGFGMRAKLLYHNSTVERGAAKLEGQHNKVRRENTPTTTPTSTTSKLGGQLKGVTAPLQGAGVVVVDPARGKRVLNYTRAINDQQAHECGSTKTESRRGRDTLTQRHR